MSLLLAAENIYILLCQGSDVLFDFTPIGHP